MEVVAGVAIGLLGLAILVVYLVRKRYVMVGVRGPSMEPTLSDGDRVVVRRANVEAIKRDQLVVLVSPYDKVWHDLSLQQIKNLVDTEWIVKRAAAIPGDPVPGDSSGATVPTGALYVLGDNPAASYDSREFGCVRGELILGTVQRLAPPAHRNG